MDLLSADIIINKVLNESGNIIKPNKNYYYLTVNLIFYYHKYYCYTFLDLMVYILKNM